MPHGSSAAPGERHEFGKNSEIVSSFFSLVSPSSTGSHRGSHRGSICNPVGPRGRFWLGWAGLGWAGQDHLQTNWVDFFLRNGQKMLICGTGSFFVWCILNDCLVLPLMGDIFRKSVLASWGQAGPARTGPISNIRFAIIWAVSSFQL